VIIPVLLAISLAFVALIRRASPLASSPAPTTGSGA